MLKSLLYSSLALIAVTPAWAGELPDEDVVVSATRIPTPAAQLASSVTVISAADIERRQDRSLPDVLRQVPGLSITQTGGAGGQTSLFLRGANGNHVKLLVDGIDMADPSTPTGAADISKLLAGDFARVEVLRGPQGALYGSDAIGGVINIVTKAGQGPLAIDANAEGGSFDTFNQMASASGSVDGLHLAATVQHQHAGATPVTPQNLLPAGQRRNDDFYDNVTATAKLGYDVTDNFNLGLVTRYYGSLGKFTGDAFDFATFSSFPSRTRTRVRNLNYQTRGTAHLALWSGRFDQTLGLAFGSNIADTQDPDNGNSRQKGDRLKLDWQGNVAVMDGQMLVLGAESARDALHPGLSFGFPSSLSRGIGTNAGYAEVQSDFGNGFYNSVSLRHDANSRFGGRTTWRVAPAWVMGDTKLKATAGTGFKAPSLQQLYGTFGGNPALKAETSFGYDVGVEQAWGALTGGVTWFHNDIQNLITSGPAPAFRNINIGRARTQGVESFVEWKALATLTLRGDYTYTDAIDGATRQALLRRPRHKASLNADWQAAADLTLDATLLYVGPQIDGNRDFSVPRLKMPDVTTLDLAASYRLTERWSVFGRLKNTFDATYQSPDGFLRPGIGAYAGLKVTL